MPTDTKTGIELYREWSASKKADYAISVLEAGGYWVRDEETYYSPIETAYMKYMKDLGVTDDGYIPHFE